MFIGAPSGSGLLTCAELAIFNELNGLQEDDDVKILYIAPNTLLCENVYANWQKRLAKEPLGLQLAMINPNHTFKQ